MLAAPLDEAIALERDEVMVDRAGGGEADGIGDLTNRRRISPLLERERDAVKNALPALDVVSGHVDSPLLIGSQTLAERMFYCQTDTVALVSCAAREPVRLHALSADGAPRRQAADLRPRGVGHHA